MTSETTRREFVGGVAATATLGGYPALPPGCARRTNNSVSFSTRSTGGTAPMPETTRRRFLGVLGSGWCLGELPPGARPPRGRDLSSTAWRVLQLMDRAGLDYIDSATAAINLEVPERRARAALEELEHEGYIRSEPVMYERL